MQSRGRPPTAPLSPLHCHSIKASDSVKCKGSSKRRKVRPREEEEN